MLQWLKVLNLFNTLTLKQIFWKSQTLFKKLEKLKVLRLTTQHFNIKLLCQKPMLRQIEIGVQIGPIAKKIVLSITTLFFQKFRFSLTFLYKELIWCPNYPNVVSNEETFSEFVFCEFKS